MNRFVRAFSIAISCLLLAGTFLAVPARTDAQVSSHNTVGPGAVRGVELALEGSLTARRGQPMRFLMTAYEVLGLSDLRVAAGATIRVSTSFAPDHNAGEAQADAYGRAVVTFDVPDDAPASFGALVEVATRSGVRRRFELTVAVVDDIALTLTSVRQPPRSGLVRVVGRLAHGSTGAAISDAIIDLSAEPAPIRPIDGARIMPPVTQAPALPAMRVRTSAAGVFTYTFRLPREVTSGFTLVARHRGPGERDVTARQWVSVLQPETPSMIVSATPSTRFAAPGERISVDVIVTRPDGRPIDGAVVTFPPDHDGATPRTGRTDARGRLAFETRLPTISEPFRDVQLPVAVRKEGFAEARSAATLRIAHARYAAAVSVDGGTLAPELPGRVYVRVVTMDGRRAPAGVRVELTGARLRGATLQGTTDAAGIATFDVTLGPVAQDDRCGGEASTALHAQISDSVTEIDTCAAVDPDAAAVVRTSTALVVRGAQIPIEVTRAARARALPVALSLLARADNGWRAVGTHVLGPNETHADLEVPADIIGEVLVRARVLVGAERQEARGGATLVEVLPSAPRTLAARLESNSAHVTFGGATSENLERSVVAFALPYEEARELRAALVASGLPTDDRARDEGEPALTESLVRALLAARTPLDIGAPSVLRAGVAVPTAAPETPEAIGLLRDPWRSRARFVAGRLALVMRALETRVAESVPEHLDDVAIREGSHWRFNQQLLDAITTAGEGGEGARGLGGEPITIDELERLDPALTYDNVARRVTRQRLFKLLVALRSYVRDRGLDLTWSWRGDPSSWLMHMVEEGNGEIDLESRDLVDGWGHPFTLRRATRTRFTTLVPVPGYEVISAGPDGRASTGDDLFDPTARVLPETSLYGRAVGESALVARLRGVELGRATVALVGDVFGLSGPEIPETGIPVPTPRGSDDSALPTVFDTRERHLPFERAFVRGEGRASALVTTRSADLVLPLSADDDEPRREGLVVAAWGKDGAIEVTNVLVTTGEPVFVSTELPARMRTAEPLTLDVHVVNMGAATLRATLAGTFEGGAATLAPSGDVALEPGTARTVALMLTSQATRGQHALVIALTDAQGRVIRRVARTVTVDQGGHPQRRVVLGLAAADGWDATLPLPSDAREIDGRLVVLAGDALADAPDFDELRARDPALAAWAYTVTSRELSPALRRDLLSQFNGAPRSQDAPPLSVACAVLALSALGTDDPEAALAAERARAALGMVQSGELSIQAAALAALATAARGDLVDEGDAQVDAVTVQVMQLVRAQRRLLRSNPNDYETLSTAAAALLLADPRDLHGRVMLERTLAALDHEDGLALVPLTPGGTARVLTQVRATLALAVAANQAGRTSEANTLLRGALYRARVLSRFDAQTAFWLFAAGAYGLFGTPPTQPVAVAVDGHDQALTLDHGRAVLPLGSLRGGDDRDVRVRAPTGSVLLAFAEARYATPFHGSSEDAQVVLGFDGDLGRVGMRAGLMLTVTAKATLDEVTVEVQLPAGVTADESWLAALSGVANVRSVEPRTPGYVRIVLGMMSEGQSVALPVAVEWRARGTRRGLAVVAYPTAQPWRTATLAPRTLEIE